MDYKSDPTRTNHGAARSSKPRGKVPCPAPDLFEPHPNLSDAVNDNIVRSEIEGGANLNSLTTGTVLEVRTLHRSYQIEYRGEGQALISGHPRFCPRPTLVRIAGSTWGGAMLWLRFIGRGMHLEFAHPVFGRIITSVISDVRVLDKSRPGQPWDEDSYCPELN